MEDRQKRRHPVVSYIKHSSFLSSASSHLRPQSYEDKTPSFRRNLLFLLALLLFVVLAVLILFYQLSYRPLIITTTPINVKARFLDTDGQFPTWDGSVTRSIISKFWTSDNGGTQVQCSCSGQNNYYNSQQYPFLNFSESSSCRALFQDSPNPFVSFCDYIDYEVAQDFKNALLQTSSVTLSPYRWQMFIYETYFARCAQVVTALISQTSLQEAIGLAFNFTTPPFFPVDANPQNGSNSTNATATAFFDSYYYMYTIEFQEFGDTLQASLQSPDGYLCAGYNVDPNGTAIDWTFDELIVPPWPATTDPVVPPGRLRNHDPETMEPMDSYLYEAYLALYCNPTICTSYQRMPVLNVLLNTAGTIATVFSGMMLLAAIFYGISRAGCFNICQKDEPAPTPTDGASSAATPGPASPSATPQMTHPAPLASGRGEVHRESSNLFDLVPKDAD